MNSVFRVLLLGWISAVGCLPLQEEPSASVDGGFLGKGTNELATALLQGYVQKEENMAYSPFGYSALLAIFSEGARGESREEIATALHFPKDVEVVRKAYRSVLERFASKKYSNAPEFRNWFYIYKNYTVNEDLQNVLRKYYLTDVRSVDRPEDYVKETKRTPIKETMDPDQKIAMEMSQIEQSTSAGMLTDDVQNEKQMETSEKSPEKMVDEKMSEEAPAQASEPTKMMEESSVKAEEEMKMKESMTKEEMKSDNKESGKMKRDTSMAGAEEKPMESMAKTEEKPMESMAKTEEKPMETMTKTEEKPMESMAKTEEKPMESMTRTDEKPMESMAKTQEKPMESMTRTDEKPMESMAKTEEKPMESMTKTDQKPMESMTETDQKPMESMTKTDQKPMDSMTKTDQKPMESMTKTDQKPMDSMTKSDEKLMESMTKTEDKPMETMTKTEEKPMDSMTKTEEKPMDSMTKTEEKPMEIMANTENKNMAPIKSNVEMGPMPVENFNGMTDSSLKIKGQDARPQMIIFNGLYYKGEWETPFEKKPADDSRVFYKSETEKVYVSTIHAQGVFNYGNILNLDAKAIELPYKGGRYSLLVLVPNSRSGLTKLISDLSGYPFSSIYDQLSEKLVDVCLPSFEINTISKPISSVNKFGLNKVTTIFDPEKADLSGITSKDAGLFVEELVQMVTFKVDADNSKANFLTASIASSRSNTQVFQINQPFLFYLRDNLEDIIIVNGKVIDPTPKPSFYFS